MKIRPGVRTFAAYAASALAGVLGMIALNTLADRTGWPGLVTVRNHATHATS